MTDMETNASALPVSLPAALTTFDDVWSPRIVTTVNDYDVRLAKAEGEHVWHVHDDTDEFFLVVEGELTIELREKSGGATGERAVVLPRGSVFTVPRGTWHKPSAAPGTAILLLEPTGTCTTGDDHDAVPDHVDSTTGHAWHS
jgi:mannose-6-phosphate isomerase-like protein (cupin superfamily)